MATEKTVLIGLFVLSVANIMVGLEAGSQASVLHTLSVGFVGSCIFYFFVVYVPERQKRKRVRDGLREQYRSLKLDIIHLLLRMSDSEFYPYRDRENLLDQQEFRRFFKCRVSPNMDKWHAVVNGFLNNEDYLREVLYSLRMLNEEIRRAMTVIDIDDEEVTGYLVHYSQVLSRMDMIQNDYEDIKLLCRDLLWPLYTGFSFTGGYPKSDVDVTKDMIDRIK